MGIYLDHPPINSVMLQGAGALWKLNQEWRTVQTMCHSGLPAGRAVLGEEQGLVPCAG